MDLFNQLQATLAGNQLGDAMTSGLNGMTPSGSNPRGAPQVWIEAIAAVRSEIHNCNKISDSLSRSGNEMEEIRAYFHKHVINGLQETLLKLKDKLNEAQQGQLGGM